MDEMLLNELYGDEFYGQDDEMTKLAQVELVEAVAAEAGIDLDELDDYELAKFAEYVLSEDDGDFEDDDYGYYEDDDFYAEEDFHEKLAEADVMGRVMARSYVDELDSLSYGDYDDFYDDEYMSDEQVKVASAMEDIENAWFIETLEGEEDFEIAGDEVFEKRASILVDYDEPALAYIESLTPSEFAKEAELRACEWLIEEGIDPVTMEYTEPDYIKLASFPDVFEANSQVAELALTQYNEDLDYAALHIINALFDRY
jgi:hypothetical protein